MSISSRSSTTRVKRAVRARITRRNRRGGRYARATTIRFAKGSRLERIYRGRDEGEIRLAAAPELAALNAAGFAVVEERVDVSVDPGTALIAGKFIAILPREIALRMTLEARRGTRLGRLPGYRGPIVSNRLLLRGISLAYYGVIAALIFAAIASLAPITSAITELFGQLDL